MLLRKMNTPDRYIQWIWICISTTSFSINLNVSLIGHFKATRRLRQGDPLFPCFFILVMEGFAQMLKGKVLNSHFDYHPRSQQLKLSSLAFANDLFILSKTDIQSIRVITKIPSQLWLTA